MRYLNKEEMTMKAKQGWNLIGKLKVATVLVRGATALMASSLAAAQEGKKIRFALDWATQGPQVPFLIPHADGCYAKAGKRGE